MSDAERQMTANLADALIGAARNLMAQGESAPFLWTLVSANGQQARAKVSESANGQIEVDVTDPATLLFPLIGEMFKDDCRQPLRFDLEGADGE